MLKHEFRDSSLPEITSDELLNPIKRSTGIAGLVLVGVFWILFTLAAIFKYPLKSRAKGVVRYVGETRIVQSPVDATIKYFDNKMSNNSKVEKGDTIALLDNSSLEIREERIRGNIRDKEIQLGNLNAQIGLLAKEFDAENRKLNALIEEAEAELDFAHISHIRYGKLANQGAISLQEWDNKKREHRIAKSRIEEKRAEKKRTLASLNSHKKSLLREKNEIYEQINNFRNELSQIKADTELYEIKAPITGTLFNFNVRNRNQVIRSGELIAQIAPENESLIVKARIKNQDRSKIALNQKVSLQVHAYPYRKNGILIGKVVEIAPDATSSPANNSINQSAATQENLTYEVTIKPLSSYVQDDSEKPIEAGMEVTAEIISEETTVLMFVLDKVGLLGAFK